MKAKKKEAVIVSDALIGLMPDGVKRILGIRHRVKATAAGEAVPTEVAVIARDGDHQLYELKTEADELDFVHGKWPKNGKFREALPGEDLSVYPSHHILREDAKKAKKEEREPKVEVPVAYEGLRSGDFVAMSLGGSGDCFAYAISNIGKDGGFSVKRVPPFVLKDARGNATKDGDAILIAKLALEKPEVFRELSRRERNIVKLRLDERQRRFVQDDRKACQQRILTASIGEAFCSDNGGFPEGGLEKVYALAKANDPVLQAILAREKELDARLEEACELVPVYVAVKPLVKGLGPKIFARILASIDVRLFDTVGKFKAFSGLHVRRDGSFPKKARGVRCNWNPNVRQAFYLLGDMFNKFPDGFWGERLRVVKADYRQKHPEPIISAAHLAKLFRETDRIFRANDGLVLDYSKFNLGTVDGLMEFYQAGWSELEEQELVVGEDRLKEIEEEIDRVDEVGGQLSIFSPKHIHKMACWRTVTEFAEWLYWKWRTLEGLPANKPRVVPPEDAGPNIAVVEVPPVAESPVAVSA